MRIWSLHPRYLDQKGLVALWREALLAQAVLLGQTKGYKHHPQLARFRACVAPCAHIARYLSTVHEEALRRGYNFDGSKFGPCSETGKIPVTRGQLEYEWEHLRRKLKLRAAERLRELETIVRPKPHPLFRVVAGSVEEWEIVGDD